LNHLTCVPQVGLGPEECLVNDTPERLKLLPLEIRADPAGNPATGHPNSVTNLKHKNDLESRNLTIWDDMGYLILSLAAALRRSSECFVRLRFAETQLKQLGRVFPALIKTAGSTVSPGQITAVLRALVAEELSVGNLRLILERLTDYELCNDADGHNVLDDTPTAFEPGNAASGDDLTRLTAFVRRGMKRQISGKFSRETNTIDAYLLDLDIEELLSRSGSVEVDGQRNANPNSEQQDDILESIRREIAQLPPTAQIPLILTTHNLRGALKTAIAQEFPRIHVVAFQELMPDLNVRPIARISRSFVDAVK
jgi:type III secretion protein V